MKAIEEIVGLKPGGIYLLRYKGSGQVTSGMAREIQDRLESVSESVGCKFVLIDQEFELIKAEK